MSAVVQGRFFKKTFVKCDDPLTKDCASMVELNTGLKNTIRYCLKLGWREDLNSGMVCPACRGNYKVRGGITDIVVYDLVFNNWKLSRIDIPRNQISLDHLNRILDKEVENKDRKQFQVKSVAWGRHDGYGMGSFGSRISLCALTL